MTSVNDWPGDNILVVAAEASSCMYAKLFMEQWKKHRPEDRFFGIGDKEMQSRLGMHCQGFAEEMAVMGLLEVAKHWPVIKSAFNGILEEVEKNPPRFALLLDYPGFNLRLAKKLHEMKVPVVYYISPQLWAWKKGRVKQVKAYVDDMMVVFPFEVDFYKENNIEVHFVGHPLVEVVEAERALTRSSSESSQKILGLMPGSRKSEISFNLKNQLQAAKILKKKMDLDVKILLAPTLNREDLQAEVNQVGIEVEFVQAKPTHMIEGCDYILTASGTATLQVALCEKPMVVMYRMNPVTAFLAKKLVNTVDAFCIVNLIAGKRIVPELFQEEARAENLAKHMEELMTQEKIRETMLTELRHVKERLGKGGATENLVNALLKKYGAGS